MISSSPTRPGAAAPERDTVTEHLDTPVKPGIRRVPALGTPRMRLALGFLFAVGGPLAVAAARGSGVPGAMQFAAAIALGWAPAVWLTDKYRHKYPYRYVSYLLASHLKAALVLTVLLLAQHLAFGGLDGTNGAIVIGLALASLVDVLVALPSRREAAGRRAPTEAGAVTAAASEPLRELDRAGALEALPAETDAPMRRFLEESLPEGAGGESSVLAIDDREDITRAAPGAPVGLVVGRRQVNAVRRLNLYLQDCAATVMMGGYVAIRYTPLEENLESLRKRFPGALYGPAYVAHFLWYRGIPKLPWLDVLYFSSPLRVFDTIFYRPQRGRRRVLARPEVWGRLAYYGFEVVREVKDGGETLLLARKTSAPVTNRRPSYYAVVALEKVGLDGDVIRLYKVRSMFPFSEFLQKRIFETHGLSTTGKFKNDFRLTEYGPLIRRSWLDELPGLINWMRGDVKLVGMRATSPHFLGLYPQRVYDRYVVVKPGLVPPIFDEKTAGFEQIVEIEDTYLRRYLEAPVRTDIAYFWYTFRDIFIRRVRSA